MNEIALVSLLWGTLCATVPGLGNGAAGSVSWPAASVTTLRSDLEQILRRGRLGGGAGVVVLSLEQGDTLFAHNADSALVPASNLKLFTSLAALHYLGPSFRYNTYLLATGPIRNGVLEGDLVLYGTGDPTLSDRVGAGVLEAFADTLAQRGVRVIRGDVVGDASYFGGPGIGIGWQTAYSNAVYAAPASALSFSENIASIELRPSAQAGDRPAVRIVPGGDGLELVNLATTVASGRTRVRFGRSGYDAPLTVSGQVSAATRSVRYPVPVSDPPLFAAAALREVASARGIAVEGVTRSVRASEGSHLAGRSLFAPSPGRGSNVRILAIHTSPPLLDVLEVVNKRSNNFMAEQVLRTLGRVVLGDGTVEGGAAAVESFGRDVLGVGESGLRVFDGSGLSSLNRTTPGALVELLRYAAKAPLWPVFWQTLPQTGTRDGLRRMAGTAAEGRVWAKTGTIQQVSALSGYVQAANGEWLVFSVLNNRATSQSAAKRLEDQIVTRLARFDRSADFIGAPSPNSGAAMPVRQ